MFTMPTHHDVIKQEMTVEGFSYTLMTTRLLTQLSSYCQQRLRDHCTTAKIRSQYQAVVITLYNQEAAMTAASNSVLNDKNTSWRQKQRKILTTFRSNSAVTEGTNQCLM